MMVQRYNQSQTAVTAWCALLGLVCSWLAYLFFSTGPSFVFHQMGYRLPGALSFLLGLGGLAAAAYSAYKTWKDRGGLYSYHESALYQDFGDSGGAYVVNHYVGQVTGSAYILGQMFMAGPLYLFKAWTAWNSKLEESAELEARLESTLSLLKAANKWQGLPDYPQAKQEILLLAQMGLIDFSAYKGTPRFKVR